MLKLTVIASSDEGTMQPVTLTSISVKDASEVSEQFWNLINYRFPPSLDPEKGPVAESHEFAQLWLNWRLAVSRFHNELQSDISKEFSND